MASIYLTQRIIFNSAYKGNIFFQIKNRSGFSRGLNVFSRVLLTAAALTALSSMLRHGATVFYHPDIMKPWEGHTIKKPWQQARKKANSALRIHDLRHV